MRRPQRLKTLSNFKFALTIGLSVGIWPSVSIAQNFDFGSCTQVDPAEPSAIASCMTSDMTRGFSDSCTSAANVISNSLLSNRSPDRTREEFDSERARFSCAPLAEAYRIFTDQETPWLHCIPDGTEGTAAHMSECISHYNATAPANDQIPLRNLDSCISLHTTYDRLVLQGINEMAYRPSRPDDRPGRGEIIDFSGANASYQWVGPYGFTGRSFSDRFNTAEYIRLNSSPFPYDCSIAADARAELTGRQPEWGACLGFDPDQVVDHFAQCIPTETDQRLDCVEGRELYESLITLANAGQRPDSYRTISCEVVAAGFDRINEVELAAAQAAAEEARTRVESAPQPTRSNQSSGGSAGLVGLLVLLAIGGGAWFFLRKDSAKPTTSRKTGPAEDPEFESADDNSYVLLENSDTTVIGWVMYQYNTIGKKAFGRFAEIMPDRVTVSDVYPLPKGQGQRKKSDRIYEDGSWRANAKTYDIQKIRGVRLSQSKPRNNNVPDHWGYSANTIIMDYGRKHVDLNYIPAGRLENEIGNFSDDAEGMMQLVVILTETIKSRSEQNISTSAEDDDDLGFEVDFEGPNITPEDADRLKKEVQNMTDRVLGSKRSGKGNTSNSDDPF